MKKDYTHMAVVLDRSGSMSSCLKDTIGGFNTFLKAQKKEEGEATISMIQFDDHYDILMDMIPIKEGTELTERTYVPRGGTALLDAIGRTINNEEAKINGKSDEEKPEKVIFVIITDGEENQSREFNREQIMEMINRHREEDKWEFVFIGANQDAIQAGNSMGIRAASSLNYDASAQGTRCMYTSLSSGMTSYRKRSVAQTLSKGFFEEDEDKKQKEDFLKNPKGPVQGLDPKTRTY